MFSTKSPIVKVVGYIVIGFFGLIIVVSFGMPDILSRMGLDNSTAAIINGEKIHVYDYFNFRDTRFGHLRNKKMDSYILDRFIEEYLLLSYAKDISFTPSEDKIVKIIKTYFRDQKTGKFSPAYFKRYKEQNRNYRKTLQDDIIKRDFYQMVQMGIAVSKNELKAENLIKNSKIQIKYSFLSNNDIKKRFKKQLIVKDSEVSAEMQKNLKEIKDPKTDKIRIKRKLEGRKLSALKKNLLSKIDIIALNNGSFSKTSSILKGKISKSKKFSPGDQVKEDKKNGKAIFPLSNSKIFRDQCLVLNKNQSSRAIKTFSGIYIFTPVFKEISKADLDEKVIKSLTKSIESEKINNLYQNLLVRLTTQSKSRKILKTN